MRYLAFPRFIRYPANRRSLQRVTKESAMNLTKSYVVDEEGEPKAVIIDYDQFKKIESALLDCGLGKAMEEVENDEEVDLDEVKRLTGFSSTNRS
jgi:hypothetical protein